MSKAMFKAAPIATESQEQAALFKWAELARINLLFHIPNGGRRDIITASRLKAEGVKAGVPDLFLPVPCGGYHGLFIELKTVAGTTSESQERWLEALNEQGYKAVVCRGWLDAADTIKQYLNLKTQKTGSV